MTKEEKFKALEVLSKKDGKYIVSLFNINGEYKGQLAILTFKNGAWDYGDIKNQYVGYVHEIYKEQK